MNHVKIEPGLSENHSPSPNNAIADTGCTGNFIMRGSPCSNIVPSPNGVLVSMPNKSTIQATHTCNINNTDLPPEATAAHIFDEIAYPLLSIGLMCEHGCAALFTKRKVEIFYRGKIILTGKRDPKTRLWTIPLTNEKPQPNNNPPETSAPVQHPEQAHSALQLPKTPEMAHQGNSAYHTTSKKDHAQFLHATCGSPVPTLSLIHI